MSKHTGGPGLLERAAEMLDLPADAVAGLSHVEIIGTRELFIENHKGILEYNDTEVKLNGGKSVIRIVGQGLVVNSMNASQLKLVGQIESVQFIGI